jgi:hypothetical protein
MDIDPGQVTAVAGQTLHTVAGLSPMAQIAAVVMIGVVGLAWVGKSYVPLLQARKRDAEPGQDDMRAVVQALTEYAVTMQHTVEHGEKLVQHSERMVEYVGSVAGSMARTVELVTLIVADMPSVPHEKASELFRELEQHRARLSAANGKAKVMA